jgi:hypothetical protein
VVPAIRPAINEVVAAAVLPRISFRNGRRAIKKTKYKNVLTAAAPPPQHHGRESGEARRIGEFFESKAHHGGHSAKHLLFKGIPHEQARKPFAVESHW